MGRREGWQLLLALACQKELGLPKVCSPAFGCLHLLHGHQHGQRLGVHHTWQCTLAARGGWHLRVWRHQPTLHTGESARFKTGHTARISLCEQANRLPGALSPKMDCAARYSYTPRGFSALQGQLTSMQQPVQGLASDREVAAQRQCCQWQASSPESRSPVSGPAQWLAPEIEAGCWVLASTRL